MLQFSDLTIKTAVANQSGAMETQNHLKNRASSKNQTNRENIIVTFFVIFFCITSIDAQQITQTIARKLVPFCKVNLQTEAFCNEVIIEKTGIKSISELNRIYESLPYRIDIAEEIIYRLYLYYGGSSDFDLALGRSFSGEEKVVMKKYCDNRYEAGTPQRETERRKREEITSKSYGLSEYNPVLYQTMTNQVKEKLINEFKKLSMSQADRDIDRKYYNYDFFNIPSYADLEKKGKYRYKNSFIVHYESKVDSYFDAGVLVLKKVIPTLNQSEDPIYLLIALNRIIARTVSPKLKIEGFDVNSEADIQIDIDYIKGVTNIKNKKGNIKFVKKYIPDDNIIEKMQKELSEKLPKSKGKLKNGSYYVRYAYVNVMDDVSFHLEFEKR